MCVNAMAFVISIPDKIEDYHSRFAEIFREISYWLPQFKIYKNIDKEGSMSDDFLKCIKEVTCKFIRLCAIAYDHFRVTSKFRRIRRVAKFIIFQDDPVAKDMLSEFIAACKSANNLNGAIALELAFKNDRELRSLITEQSENRKILSNIDNRFEALSDMLAKHRLSEENEHLIDRLCKLLDINREKCVSSQEERLRDINSQRLMAGEWLSDCSAYQSWLNFDTDSPALLYLSGDKNTGKTNLIPRIIHDIHKVKQDKAVHIAWFFLDPDSEPDSASTSVKNKDLAGQLSIALRSMTIQLAASSLPYLKYITRHLTEKSKNDQFRDGIGGLDCGELFDHLKFSAWASSHYDEDTIFYLIFDGLQPYHVARSLLSRVSNAVTSLYESRDAADSQSHRAAPNPPSSNLRIFVTGRDRDNAFLAEESMNLARIDICSTEPESISINKVDIENYIMTIVDEDCDLQHVREREPELFDDLVKDLVKTVRGSFSIIETKLHRMKELINNGLQDPRELKNIANDRPVGGDQSILADTVMSELNSKLTQIEICQINHILKWVVYSEAVITIKMLDTIISLEPGLNVLFQEFSHRIKTKPIYRKLLDTDSRHGRVDLQGNLSAELRKRGDMSSDDGTLSRDSNSSISMEITMSLKNVDQYDVRRFFWDLSERASFRQFDFGHVSRMDMQAEVIRVNRYESTATVIVNCLDILNREKDCEESDLPRVAVDILPALLMKAKKFIEESNTRKVELFLGPRRAKIVAKLFRLFQFPKNYLHLFERRRLAKSWINPESVKAMEWWMGVENEQSLSGPERAMLRDFCKKNDVGGFLFPLMKEIACKWLVEEGWFATEAWEWVDQYLSIVGFALASIGDTRLTFEKKRSYTKLQEDDQTDRYKEVKSRDTDVEQRIYRAREWVQTSILPEYTPDSTWYLRLARTYMRKKAFEPALKSYEEALMKPGCNFAEVHRYLAMLHEGQSNYEQAINEMAKSLQYYGDKLSKEDEKHYKQGRMDLAKWYMHQDSPEKAFSWYDDILKENPFDYAVQADNLIVSFKAGNHARVTQILKRLRGSEGSIRRNRLPEFLLHAARNPSDHKNWSHSAPYRSEFSIDLIVGAAYGTGNLEMIEESLETAQKGPTPEGSIERVLLLWAKGTVHFFRSRGKGEKFATASDMWEKARKELDEVMPLRRKQRDTDRFHKIGLQCSLYYHLETNEESQTVEKKLKDIYDSVPQSADRLPLTRGTFLAHHYASTNRLSKARELLRQSMQDAFDLLTDEHPNKDWDGYSKMARVLKATGDRANALAAFSLVRPFKAQESVFKTSTNPGGMDLHDHVQEGKREKAGPDGPLQYSCSGYRCKCKWTHANKLWICEVCPDVYLCCSCYKELKRGDSAFMACHPRHEHIFVPEWSDKELRNVGRKHVRVLGQTDDTWLKDGFKGEKMLIQEWLKKISKDWNVIYTPRSQQDD